MTTIFICLIGESNGVGQDDINKVNQQISNAIQWNNMPERLAALLAILDKNLHILSCLPAQRNGNCYQPKDYCTLPGLKLDGQPIEAHISICRSPVKIIIR